MTSTLSRIDRNLVVQVNVHPIQEIRIFSDLSTLEAVLDHVPDNEDAPYVAMSEVISNFCLVAIEATGFGVASGSGNIATVSSCRSVKQLREMGDNSAADELTKQGYFHSIQYPIDALKFRGYINETQMQQIRDYISNQMSLLTKPEEIQPKQRTWADLCTIL